MIKKPDYVANYDKPVNTEIKHINGHWYLYERKNIYDPKIHRSRKKSGDIIGKLTEDGLVLSKARVKKENVMPAMPNDVVEVGAVNYFYQHTKEMRNRLMKYFPDIWESIYAIVLIRAIYDCRFRRLQLHYEDSILSYLYPSLSFSAPNITSLLSSLGRQREVIRNYMMEMVGENERFIVFDGHRLISSSKTMDNAELGYDSKMRYKEQINLIYMFSMGVNTGYPAYYKQFPGSTVDVKAFANILKESGSYGKDCTVIADKGFASDEDFDLLEDSELYYIIPLKRGNRFVKGRIPPSPTDFEHAFNYHGRGIHCTSFHEDGFNIHLFLDTELFAEEVADATRRMERKNSVIELKKEKELVRRKNGKGKMTDEQLRQLVPMTINDIYENKQEMGTITIKTNRTDLNSVQVYNIYKQRQAVEQFFKTYGDTMEYEASYMRNNYSEEAWLFLNHLSSTICINAIENIASIEESKNISYKDLTQSLVKIKAGRIDESWLVNPVKKSVRRICGKMNIDIDDLSSLDL